ncbi:MAG: hypothetical protein ACYCPQ_00910 [Elusimicrobiota bacterium]
MFPKPRETPVKEEVMTPVIVLMLMLDMLVPVLSTGSWLAGPIKSEDGRKTPLTVTPEQIFCVPPLTITGLTHAWQDGGTVPTILQQTLQLSGGQSK